MFNRKLEKAQLLIQFFQENDVAIKLLVKMSKRYQHTHLDDLYLVLYDH